MAKHDDFYPLLLVELPGCPIPTIKLALNRSASRFCEKSKAWREKLDPITAVVGTTEYEIDLLPADSRLILIDQVWLDGREMDPSLYEKSTLTLLKLTTAPSAAGTLEVLAVLAPTLDAQSLPDVLADRWYEGVSEGAKAFLKKIPNQPWYDPTGAATAEQLFISKAAEARIESETGFVRGSMRTTPRAFGV